MHDLLVLFLHFLPLPIFILAEHCKLCSFLCGLVIGTIAVKTRIELTLVGGLLMVWMVADRCFAIELILPSV